MKLLFVLAMSPLALVMADAAEQDTVNRCATIIREFQQMPEKAIPRDDDAAVALAKRRSCLRHSSQPMLTPTSAANIIKTDR
jgi:hypothetical protein